MRHIRRILLSFAIIVRGNEASLRSSTRWNNLPAIVEEFKCRVSGSFFKELLVGRKASCGSASRNRVGVQECLDHSRIPSGAMQVAKFAINSLFFLVKALELSL